MAAATLAVRISSQIAEFQKSFADATRTAQKFERDFANTATSVSAQQKRITDAFASFSGDKLAREASAVAKAVDQLGGATKLTATEQAKVNALMTEAIAKYTALGQKAPAGMLALAKATSSAGSATSKWLGDFSSQVAGMAAGMISAQAVISGVQAVFSGFVSFIGSSVQSFAAAEAAEKKMTVALTNLGLATPATVTQMNDLAGSFQKTTIYSDDLINEMQALLIQVGGVAPHAMDAALKASTDLAAGLGIDLEQATTLVAKAFAGNTESLGRYGIKVDEAKVKSEGMTAVLDEINSRFGGQAAAATDTYAGKVAQLANEWDNLKEAVGKFIVEQPATIGVLRDTTNLFRENEESSGGYLDKLEQFRWFPGLAQISAGLEVMNDHYRDLNEQAALFKQTAALVPPTPKSITPPPAPTLGDQSGVAAAVVAAQLAAWKADEAAAKQHAETLKKLREDLYGTTAIAQARNYTAVVTDASRLSAEGQAQVNKVVGEGIAAYQRLGQTAPPAMNALYIKTVQLPPVISGIGTAAIGTTIALKDMATMPWPITEKIQELKRGTNELQQSLQRAARLQAGAFRALQEEGSRILEQARRNLLFGDVVRDTFRRVGRDLSTIIADAFTAPTVMGAVLGVADAFGARLAEGFRVAAKIAADEGRALTAGQVQMGRSAVALNAFVQGYQIGQSGGRLQGVVGGALSGAVAGAPFGYYSAAVGAFAGGFGGLVGGEGSVRDQRRRMAESLQNLQTQAGGLDKLRKMAERAGFEIDRLFTTRDPKEFDRLMGQYNRAIEQVQQRMEALGKAVEGVNARLELFAAPFRTAADAGDRIKLAEIAQRSQPAFERLGVMIRATFAGLVTETGNAYDAILAMEPAFKVLQQATEEWGLTNTAVTEELLANYKLVTDEAFKPLFEAIVASGQVLGGLADANALDPATFQALATDIGQSIQDIVDKGGDMRRTLALSAPVLQTLWENQQRYGTITDETTQSILKEAQTMGIVGPQMRDVNQKILDVLLIIAEVLGATIPDHLRNLPSVADDAATGIEDAFAGIDIPPIHVQTIWEGPGDQPLDLRVPSYGRGGIVRRPTLALIGESGPEAVVPLGGGGVGLSSTYITDVYLDGEKIARSTAKRLPRVMRSMGV